MWHTLLKWIKGYLILLFVLLQVCPLFKFVSVFKNWIKITKLVAKDHRVFKFEWVVCFLGRSAKHTYKFLFPMDFKVFSALTKKWNSAENSHIPFTWIHQLLTFLPHLLYHSVCVNVCVCQFVYIYTMIFWNHLRVSCRHWGPLNFSWCFLKSKKFSENHGAMIKIRKLNIDTHYILPYLRLYVNFINCALPTPS